MSEARDARRAARAKERKDARRRERAERAEQSAHNETDNTTNDADNDDDTDSHDGTDTGDNSDKFEIFPNGESDPISENQTAFPEWSWEHVRPWVILRRDTAYDSDQVQSIAGHDVLVLEKMNGYKTYGTNEAGSLEAAKRVKAVNPKIKIFFYLNAMIHYPGYAANETFNHTDWPTRDANNQTILFKNRYIWYDHTNLDFREWWITRALDMLAHQEMDGVFIDAIMKTAHPTLCAPDHAAAYFETAMQLRQRLPQGKLLIGNALRANARGNVGGYGNIKHLQYLDGSYLEGWLGTTPTLIQSLELMAAALKAGRMVLPHAEPSLTEEEKTSLNEMTSLNDRYALIGKHIDFYLGLFLLIVEKYAYFSYHHGVDANPNSRVGKALFDSNRFEEITRRLGEPLGQYVAESEFVFVREFEYQSVRVDLELRKGELSAREIKRDYEL